MANNNMQDSRWFLAHGRWDADKDVDDWRDQLTEALSEQFGEDYAVTVVPGRDDYKRSAAEAGGWKGWSEAVVRGMLWDGSPKFHGIVIPCRYLGKSDVVVGRSTHDMINGFAAQGKQVIAWDVKSGEFLSVRRSAPLPGQDYKSYGRLLLEDDQEPD
tara:strand:- start:294 stop:767 length:474 start_codon:yes stop_codon:yes gene_type:complete